MTRDRLSLGHLGEVLAAERLAALGMRVTESNWRCHGGEIDLVARDGQALVIVEVRTRRPTRGHSDDAPRYGRAEESVGPAKRRRLMELGALYVQSVGWQGPWRIDVVAVDLDARGSVVRFAHYPNAVCP